MNVVYFPLGGSTSVHTGDSKVLFQCTYSPRVKSLVSVKRSAIIDESVVKFLLFRGYSDSSFKENISKRDKIAIPVDPSRPLDAQIAEACQRIVTESPPSAVAAQPQPQQALPSTAPVAPLKEKKRVMPVALSTEQAEQHRIESQVPTFADDIARTNLLIAYMNVCVKRTTGTNEAAVKAALAPLIAKSGMVYTVVANGMAIDQKVYSEAPPEIRTGMLLATMTSHPLDAPKKVGGKRKKDDDGTDTEQPSDSICEDIEKYLRDVFFDSTSTRVRKDTLKQVTEGGVKATTIIPENAFLGLMPVYAHSSDAPLSTDAINVDIEGTRFVNPDPQGKALVAMRGTRYSSLLRIRFVPTAEEANVQAVATTTQQVAIITTRVIRKDEHLTMLATRTNHQSYFNRLTGKLFFRAMPDTPWTTVTVDTWTDGIPSFSKDSISIKDYQSLIIPEQVAFKIDTDLQSLPKNGDSKIDLSAVIRALHGGTRWADFKRLFEPYTQAEELARYTADSYILSELKLVLAKPNEYMLFRDCQREFQAMIASERERIRQPGEFPFFHDETLYNRMTMLRERCISQTSYTRSIDELSASERSGGAIGKRYRELAQRIETLAKSNRIEQSPIVVRRQAELAADHVIAEIKLRIADEAFTTSLNVGFSAAENLFQTGAYDKNSATSQAVADEIAAIIAFEAGQPATTLGLEDLMQERKDRKVATLLNQKLARLSFGTHEQLEKEFRFYRVFVDTLQNITSGELTSYHTYKAPMVDYRTFYARELLSDAGLGRLTDTDVFDSDDDDLLDYVTQILAANMKTAKSDDIYVYPSVCQLVRNVVAYRRDCVRWYNLVSEKKDNLSLAAKELETLLSTERSNITGVTPPLDIESELATLEEARLKAIAAPLANISMLDVTDLPAAAPVGAAAKVDPLEYSPNDDKGVAAVKALARFMRARKLSEEREKKVLDVDTKEQPDLEAFRKLDEEGKYREIKKARQRNKLTADMVLEVLSPEKRENFVAYESLWEMHERLKALEAPLPAVEAVATGSGKKKTKIDTSDEDKAELEKDRKAEMEDVEESIKNIRETEDLYLEEQDLADVRAYDEKDLDIDDPAALRKAETDDATRRLDIALHYYSFLRRKAVRDVKVEELLGEMDVWSLLGVTDEEEDQLEQYPTADLYAREHDDFFFMQSLCQRDIVTDSYSPTIQIEKLGLSEIGDVASGGGVVTSKRLPFGLCLGIYGGEVIDGREFSRRYPPESTKSSEFVFKLDNSRNYAADIKYIDGSPYAQNTNIMDKIRDYRHAGASGPNVEFVELGDLPVIKIITLRDIQPGEELLADFGEESTVLDEPIFDSGNNNNNNRRPPARKTAPKKQRDQDDGTGRVSKKEIFSMVQ